MIVSRVFTDRRFIFGIHLPPFLFLWSLSSSVFYGLWFGEASIILTRVDLPPPPVSRSEFTLRGEFLNDDIPTSRCAANWLHFRDKGGDSSIPGLPYSPARCYAEYLFRKEYLPSHRNNCRSWRSLADNPLEKDEHLKNQSAAVKLEIILELRTMELLCLERTAILRDGKIFDELPEMTDYRSPIEREAGNHHLDWSAEVGWNHLFNLIREVRGEQGQVSIGAKIFTLADCLKKYEEELAQESEKKNGNKHRRQDNIDTGKAVEESHKRRRAMMARNRDYYPH